MFDWTSTASNASGPFASTAFTAFFPKDLAKAMGALSHGTLTKRIEGWFSIGARSWARVKTVTEWPRRARPFARPQASVPTPPQWKGGYSAERRAMRVGCTRAWPRWAALI